MDAESRQMLAATVEQMRQLLPPKVERYVRWTAPENLHVTLKFLGETPDGEVASLIAKAQEMLIGQTAFLCRAYAVRAFPSSRGPSILRTEVEGGIQLTALAGELERALESLGYERERRAFVGHVTLGRIRDPGAARSVLEVLGQYPLDVPFAARHVTLFQSELTPRGPIYTALRRMPLANEPGPDSPMSGGAAVAPDADTHIPQHKENDNGG
jgi:2'-5' RNA ligase